MSCNVNEVRLYMQYRRSDKDIAFSENVVNELCYYNIQIHHKHTLHVSMTYIMLTIVLQDFSQRLTV